MSAASPARVTTSHRAVNELAVATFNVENLDRGDRAVEVRRPWPSLIVNNLRSPDIIALEEIQDNDGPTNDGDGRRRPTLNTLIAAIDAAGRPRPYEFRQIDPVDDQDGGEPGGNIRVGFLFRTDRGLGLRRPARRHARPPRRRSSTTAACRSCRSAPAAIDPTNAALNCSRKPLAGEFTFNGQTLFVIANHFNSKGGDQPLFGRFQPPTRSDGGPAPPAGADRQRLRRRRSSPSTRTPTSSSCGDLNDFEFSETMNDPHGRRHGAPRPDRRPARRTSATATCSRATRRSSTTSS